jgi:uncharacterized membrane protein YpjA
MVAFATASAVVCLLPLGLWAVEAQQVLLLHDAGCLLFVQLLKQGQ